jgi:hypothetical protein
VDPIRPAGLEGDIYVIDQEDQFSYRTSMMCRVVGIGPGCSPELVLGGVYICPVYCWDDVELHGETWHLTHEENLYAQIEGYDDVGSE